MTSGEKAAEFRGGGTVIINTRPHGIIEAPSRAVTPETRSIGDNGGTVEEGSDALDIGLRHLLLNAVGAEAGDSASDKDLGLVNRVAEVLTGVATNDQGAGLAHKRAHMADRTGNDNGDSFHRDAAARAGIAFDDDEPAAPRGRGGLRGVAAHADRPAHNVLGEASAGMAVDDNRRRRVHAGAVIADMPLDLDMHRFGDADCDRVGAVRIQHLPMTLICPGGEPVQSLVQRGYRTPSQIDLDHWRCQE